MPGKKKEKPSTKHRISSSPFPFHPESLGILFQTLSLGEKNEIRFKRVFMENRSCAQCGSSGSLALGSREPPCGCRQRGGPFLMSTPQGWPGPPAQSGRKQQKSLPYPVEARNLRSRCRPGGSFPRLRWDSLQASFTFWRLGLSWIVGAPRLVKVSLRPLPPPAHTPCVCACARAPVLWFFIRTLIESRPTLIQGDLSRENPYLYCIPKDYFQIRAYPEVPGECVFCGGTALNPLHHLVVVAGRPAGWAEGLPGRKTLSDKSGTVSGRHWQGVGVWDGGFCTVGCWAPDHPAAPPGRSGGHSPVTVVGAPHPT